MIGSEVASQNKEVSAAVENVQQLARHESPTNQPRIGWEE